MRARGRSIARLRDRLARRALEDEPGRRQHGGIADFSMNRWMITDPLIFFGVAGLVALYILYIMIRRRKGERPGFRERETDL